VVEPSIVILPAASAVPEAITPKTVALKSIFLKSFMVIVMIELIRNNKMIKESGDHEPVQQGSPSAAGEALQTSHTTTQRKNTHRENF
jgi:hypothetical protein